MCAVHGRVLQNYWWAVRGVSHKYRLVFRYTTHGRCTFPVFVAVPSGTVHLVVDF